MHSEDEGKEPVKRARSKKCPLCFDTIYATETRPVRWYVGQEGEPPREGGDVVLRLVMRSAGSTLAMPRDGAEVLGKDEDIPWYFAAEVMDYARVLRGSEDYMIEQFDKEIVELRQQAQEDEVMFGEDNVQWAKKAIRNIQETKEKVHGIGNPPESALKPAEPKPKRPPIVFSEDAPEFFPSGQDANGESVPTPGENVQQRKMSISSQTSRTSVPATLAEIRNRQHHDQSRTPSEYFFYQALMHYYLSPLDIRILKAAFENFSAFPATILPRVERVSTGHVVDDDLRKRTKYLAHLPYGCEVSFLECDWTDTVAPEILERFKPDIERRRKKHQDKEGREEKARIRAEKAEYAEFNSARRKRPSIPERFSANDFLPLASSSNPDAQPITDGEDASTSPPWPVRRGEGFASLASPSTSPSAPRTVWGTTAVAGASPVLVPLEHDGDDGWLQDWEKDLLQEEEMIAQAQAMSLGDEGESSTSKKLGGGKGKKKKKITLMSTNVRRGA